MKTIQTAGILMAIALAATGVFAAPATPPVKPPAKAALAKPPPRKPQAKAVKSTAAKVAAQKQTQPLPAKSTEPGPQQIDYPGGVTGSRDLIYALLPGFRPLSLDLYQPHRAPKDFPKPALIFVHGGGWSGGDARHGGGFDDFPAVLAALAEQQNYVVASINYRLSGEARFPAALQDVKTAIRWLRSHADEYDIDITRIAIWGEEAGGQLASLAGTSCGVAILEPSKTGNAGDKMSDCVQAVIDWHGITDLATLAADRGQATASPTAEGAYLGCEPAACVPGLVRTASPIAYVGANSPPFLIQHGAHKTVPLAQSQKLSDALNDARIPVALENYADSDTDVAKKSIDRLKQFLAMTFPRKSPEKAPPPRPKSGPLPY